MAMRRELHDRIKAVGGRLHLGETSYHDEMQFTVAAFAEVITPTFGRGGGIGQKRGPVNQQHGFIGDADVIPVQQDRLDILDKSQVVLGRVLLRDKNVLIFSIPPPCPVLVGPADTKWKIRLPRFNQPP